MLPIQQTVFFWKMKRGLEKVLKFKSSCSVVANKKSVHFGKNLLYLRKLQHHPYINHCLRLQLSYQDHHSVQMIWNSESRLQKGFSIYSKKMFPENSVHQVLCHFAEIPNSHRRQQHFFCVLFKTSLHPFRTTRDHFQIDVQLFSSIIFKSNFNFPANYFFQIFFKRFTKISPRS